MEELAGFYVTEPER